jgi:hypothetical protein
MAYSCFEADVLSYAKDRRFQTFVYANIRVSEDLLCCISVYFHCYSGVTPGL